MARGEDMASFWDERAAEDAFYFVDNRLRFKDPDEERFWSQGEEDLDLLLGYVHATVRETDRVVEIGCGLGRLTRVLAARAADVRAVDVSSAMLERAQKLNANLDNVEWIHGDGTTLAGVEDASADCCVSHVVFQHIPDPAITLGYVREMGRVLRPGGWSAFQISTDPSVHVRGFGEKTRDRVRQALGRGPKGMTNENWLGSAVRIEDLRRTAEAAGLEVVATAYEGTQYTAARLVRGST